MPPNIRIEAVLDHEYRVHIEDRGDSVDSEIIVHPDVLADLGFTPADEQLVVHHTAEFLAEHQPVIDFPALVYLDEVAAAYRDYPEQLRLRFDRRRPGPGPHE
ncbi:hypothetical protein [Prescottella agglutinans]|uniref:Uncharacterized protein n=1 Tax=Prescottella agglutinans TaxID=1644129 RepID=A0ABT6MCL7_9NOCA|nr:hypothetical protein [Prescottella agglutinans]MDH6282064.1 hypothetical protein [Prescottella agglutinans]